MSTVDEYRRKTASGRSGSPARRSSQPGDPRARARALARRRRKRRQRRIIICVFALVLLLLAVLIGRGVINYRSQKEKEALYTAGVEYLNDDNYDAAITNFNQVIEKSKGKTGNLEKNVLMYKAEAEYKKGDYQAAVATCDILIAADGDKDEYLRLKSQGQMELGLYEEALTYLPLAPVVHNRIALQAIEEGRYEDALASIESGLAAGDTEASRNLEVNRAVVYERMGDFDRALELFEAVIQKYGSDETIESEIEFLKTR